MGTACVFFACLFVWFSLCVLATDIKKPDSLNPVIIFHGHCLNPSALNVVMKEKHNSLFKCSAHLQSLVNKYKVS